MAKMRNELKKLDKRSKVLIAARRNGGGYRKP